MNKLYLYLYDEKKTKKIYKKDISTHVHTQTYFTAADLFIFVIFCVIFLRLTTLDYANMYIHLYDHKTYLHMYNVYPQQQAIAAVAARYLIYVHILRNGSTNKKKNE